MSKNGGSPGRRIRSLNTCGCGGQRGDAGGGTGPGRPRRRGLSRRVVEPRVIQLVMPGGRAEVPDDRLAAARQEREPDQLVHRPGADVGGRHVPDVGHVETEQRAQVGTLELCLQLGETLRAQALEVDALLPVDRHRSEGTYRHSRAPQLSVCVIIGLPRSASMTMAALRPGAPDTEPPGCVVAPVW